MFESLPLHCPAARTRASGLPSLRHSLLICPLKVALTLAFRLVRDGGDGTQQVWSCMEVDQGPPPPSASPGSPQGTKSSSVFALTAGMPKCPLTISPICKSLPCISSLFCYFLVLKIFYCFVILTFIKAADFWNDFFSFPSPLYELSFKRTCLFLLNSFIRLVLYLY